MSEREGFVASRYADSVDEDELDAQARKVGGMPPKRERTQHPADPARIRDAEQRRSQRQSHDPKPKPEPDAEPQAKPTRRARAKTGARRAAGAADRGLAATATRTRAAGSRGLTLSGLPASGRSASRTILQVFGWGVALSLGYLLLNNAQRSGSGRSAIELLFASLTTGVMGLVDPAADPLNPSVLTGAKTLTKGQAKQVTAAASSGTQTVSTVADLAAHPSAIATATPAQAHRAGAAVATDLSNPLLAAAGAIAGGLGYHRPPRRRSHP